MVSGQISFGPFPIVITTHVAFYVQSRRDFNGQADLMITKQTVSICDPPMEYDSLKPKTRFT